MVNSSENEAGSGCRVIKTSDMLVANQQDSNVNFCAVSLLSVSNEREIFFLIYTQLSMLTFKFYLSFFLCMMIEISNFEVASDSFPLSMTLAHESYIVFLFRLFEQL